MAGHEQIIWNDTLLTGVAKIDEQHRILVNLLNEANVRLAGSPTRELLERITQDLLSYALYHFETEEELMREAGYAEARAPEDEAHRNEHRAFSRKVIDLRGLLKAGGMVSREELLGFLNDWLVHHILATDKRLGAFLIERGFADGIPHPG